MMSVGINHYGKFQYVLSIDIDIGDLEWPWMAL